MRETIKINRETTIFHFNVLYPIKQSELHSYSVIFATNNLVRSVDELLATFSAGCEYALFERN